MFKGTVHLDNGDKIEVKKHNGMRYDFILKFGNSCQIFVNVHQLEELRKALDKVLPNGKRE